MNKYINTILTVSIVGGIINSIAPGKLIIKKYVGYIVSLVCILCLISPLINILVNTNNIKEGIKNFTSSIFLKEELQNSNSLIINTGTDYICDGIKQVIIDKYGFDEKDIDIELVLDKTNTEALKIQCVNVFLTGKASWSDANRIEDYLNDLIGTEIEVKRR